MHARALDVLHDPRDHHGLAVGDGVDLDLHADQVLVDQHLAPGERAQRPVHVALELFGVAHDLHGPAAQHIGRPHQHRIADALRDGQRLFQRCRGVADRLRDAERVQR